MTSTDVLAPDTDMGAVTLLVNDLDATTSYYVDGVGLELLDSGVDSVVLGRGHRACLELRAASHLHAPATGAAGLFHTAVVFDTRAALAKAVYSVATKFPRSFTGSADHLVSLAFYFDDPEGNGLELYWDRPRSDWRWEGSRLQMASLHLDARTFVSAHLVEPGVVEPGATSVGHVHLRVGDIATARSFYVDTVGFETTAELGDQALFVSAGGYHHHVGMNTWHSRGAGPRTPALGLGQVAVRLPHPDALGALRERLVARGVRVQDDGRTLSFDDPWRNAVRAALAV